MLIELFGRRNNFMKIIFTFISYPDEKHSNLYSDIVRKFSEEGHEVSVVTVKETGETSCLSENGISILRVKTGPLFNVNFIVKGITTLSLPFLFKRQIKKHFKDKTFDLCVYPTPPITFAGLVKWIKKKYNCNTYLILRDIFPQNAVDVGIMKKNIIFKYFRIKERALYKLSDAIGCMSQGNIDYVMKHNQIEEEKFHLLPNWKKIDYNIDQYSIDSDLLKVIENKFVIIFGGVIGIAQGLDFIIDVAEKLIPYKEILFLFLGEGNKKQSLIDLIKKRELNNILFYKKIPTNEYKSLVLRSNVGLISLNKNFSIPNIPSKTLEYFEAKLPIIAVTDVNTDYDKIIEESQGGLWSENGDIDACVENILYFYNNSHEAKTMGINGFEYLKKNLTVDVAYETMLKKSLKNYKENKLEM